MQSVIELHTGNADFKTRWMLIKMLFSRALPHHEKRSEVRIKWRERGIWQRRYWEHLIKNETDYHAHVDYVQLTL